MLPSLIVRLPPAVKDWIVVEAHKGHRSMNSIVIEALSLLMSARFREERGPRHDAAVAHALNLAELSHRDCIISRSRHLAHQTELLVQEPVTGKLDLIARVTDEEVLFFTEAGDAHQSVQPV
jgi:hypothetical protein